MKFIKDVLFGPPVWDINTLKPLDKPKEYSVDYSPSPFLRKCIEAEKTFDESLDRVDSTIDILLPGIKGAGTARAFTTIMFSVVFFGTLIALLSLTL